MQDRIPFLARLCTFIRTDVLGLGEPVDVTAAAQAVGLRFPVFLTRAVYDKYVLIPKGVTGQDQAERLWKVVWMTRYAMRRHRLVWRAPCTRCSVPFYVRNNNRAPQRVELLAMLRPRDKHDPSPVLTVMMPYEE